MQQVLFHINSILDNIKIFSWYKKPPAIKSSLEICEEKNSISKNIFMYYEILIELQHSDERFS